MVKMVKNPGNGRLNNLNDLVLNVLIPVNLLGVHYQNFRYYTVKNNTRIVTILFMCVMFQQN